MIRGKKFLKVACGDSHSVLLRDDFTLLTIGSSYYRENRGVFESPSGEFIDIAAGKHYSMAIRKDGKVFTWGSKKYLHHGIPKGKYLQVVCSNTISAALSKEGNWLSGRDIRIDIRLYTI